jgi:uncharacterized membrane protein YidH (DUF202 family)
MRMIGIVLVVLGILGVVWGGVSWTRKERVVDLGPVEINRETRESVPLPPIAGAVLLVAGVALIVGAKR